MQSLYFQFIEFLYDLFSGLTDFFFPLGIPFGPYAWFVILVVFTPMLLIIVLLVIRGRSSTGSVSVDEGIRKIIASTGDVSSGMAGAKKLKFLKTPAEALIFLKIEENAIQQALSAIDYYVQQGELDDFLKSKLIETYQARLDSVRGAIAKDEEFKEIVDTSTAVDRARSDYLQKLAAMSGTSIETDETDVTGPASVGMPSTTTPIDEVPPSAGLSGGAPPDGGPPSAGPPTGGPPGGGPPSGGPPGGTLPSGGPPTGGPPSGASPGSGPPSGGPPGGGPPGGISPSAGTPSGGSPAGAAPSSTSGKSSLQSEMLQEMERLKALMGGD